jgi:Kef-type K+ transport system membrane component KefB
MEPIVLLGLIILLAAALSVVAKWVKQPPLVAYLIGGVLLIPIKSVFDIRTDELDPLLAVSQKLGIVLLLFMAGLEIRPEKIKKHLKSALVLSLSQIVLTLVFIYLLAVGFFDKAPIEGLYIGIAIALSSTIVVVKVLSVRKELHTLHGQVLIAIMIVQDIVALVALTFFSSLHGAINDPVFGLYIVFVKGCGTFCLLLLISRSILEKVFEMVARSIEEIFLMGIAWCFVGVLVAHFFQFSIELGAFIAGLTIASLPFSFEIRDKSRSLRDFGLLLLFISVGSSITLSWDIILSTEAWIYIFFALFGTFFILQLFTNVLGMEKKQGFLISAIPSQISEFSIVIISYGLIMGDIRQEVFSMITIVAIITIILSSFMLENLNWFFKRFNHFLFFHHLNPNRHRRGIHEHNFEGHVVVYGMGHLGNQIVQYFLEKKKDVIVVDWVPDRVKHAKRMGCSIMYGDAGDPDVWEETRSEFAHIVINTIDKNQEDDVNFIQWIKRRGKKPIMIAETNSPEDEVKLKSLGYDLVLMPGEITWNALTRYFKKHKI